MLVSTLFSQSNCCFGLFDIEGYSIYKGRCDRMVVGFYNLPVQSVPTTTKVVISNPVHGEVYLIQPYVIKFVSDLQQVGGFLWVLRFPPSIKLTDTLYLKYC